MVPVGFRYNAAADSIDIGGLGMDRSMKWRDLIANPNVAFVIDDLASTDLWTPRGIELRGTAELHEAGGESIGPGFGPSWLRIRPRRVVAWASTATPSGRRAMHGRSDEVRRGRARAEDLMSIAVREARPERGARRPRLAGDHLAGTGPRRLPANSSPSSG